MSIENFKKFWLKGFQLFNFQGSILWTVSQKPMACMAMEEARYHIKGSSYTRLSSHSICTFCVYLCERCHNLLRIFVWEMLRSYSWFCAQGLLLLILKGTIHVAREQIWVSFVHASALNVPACVFVSQYLNEESNKLRPIFNRKIYIVRKSIKTNDKSYVFEVAILIIKYISRLFILY